MTKAITVQCSPARFTWLLCDDDYGAGSAFAHSIFPKPHAGGPMHQCSGNSKLIAASSIPRRRCELSRIMRVLFVVGSRNDMEPFI